MPHCARAPLPARTPAHLASITPMFLAATCGFDRLVFALFQHGADLNPVRCSDGATPLLQCAASGREHMVDLLCVLGADVNARLFVSGATALHLAAANGHIGVVQVCLGGRVCARACAERQWCMGAWECCPRAGSEGIVGQLSGVQGLVSFGWVWECRRHPVCRFAHPLPSPAPTHSRTLAGVQVLLSHGAGMNAQRWDDACTPLYAAAAVNDRAVVDLLCRSGASVNLGRRVRMPASAMGAVSLSPVEDGKHTTDILVWSRHRTAIVTPVRDDGAAGDGASARAQRWWRAGAPARLFAAAGVAPPCPGSPRNAPSLPKLRVQGCSPRVSRSPCSCVLPLTFPFPSPPHTHTHFSSGWRVPRRCNKWRPRC
jgi:hypothetical protein